MRTKHLKQARHPLSVGEALVTFAKLKRGEATAADAAKLGQRLVRELQHMHGVLAELRGTLPVDYNGYFDPARLDTVLARTVA